ncbi:MAG: histidinol dehydrogenase [Actinomycetota bacterium]|jgi:histidinol dehydrogenase|nr:histidinol dehydrogenase [Actinomycetota bacterium]
MLELIDGRNQQTPVHIPRPRPMAGGGDPDAAVREIVDDVRLRGDEAVLHYTEVFDRARLTADHLLVGADELAAAVKLVPRELIDALEVMAARLRRTCEHQFETEWREESPDESIGELVRPLRRVGIYVPGGRAAYPSSVVMAAVPAQVAGVEGLAIASPPGPGGEIAEPVLAACAVAGVTEVYRIGGAQAIAALAYGTASVRPVDKIVGPGNIFVTRAKRMVHGWVGIDSEAGPTEIAIVADENASAPVVAADLIAQAEHGPLGTHVLITWAPGLVDEVNVELQKAVQIHEHPEDVENALIEGGRAVLVRDLDHALATANAFAPEHLELLFEGARAALESVRNAGAVFVGPYSPVSVGDYVAGTDHVLPSSGTARWASGLSVRDFIKTIYVCDLERPALERLAPHVDALAEAEGLKAHARAVSLRLDSEG